MATEQRDPSFLANTSQSKTPTSNRSPKLRWKCGDNVRILDAASHVNNLALLAASIYGSGSKLQFTDNNEQVTYIT
jgi:hypothetical protein